MQVLVGLQLVGAGGHDDHAVLELLFAVLALDRGLVVADEALDLFDLGGRVDVDELVRRNVLEELREVGLRVEPFEGVVELGVVAAEGLLALHDVGLIPLVGQGQGRRDAGQTAADDEGRVIDAQLAGLQGLEELRLGDGHAHEVLGLLGGCLGLVHVHPGGLVADVGHFEEVAVEAGLLAVFLEQALVGPGRAGGDHHSGEVVFLDDLAHLHRRVLGAGEEVVRGEHHVGQGLRIFHDGGHVHDAADVDAAVADENAGPGTDALDVLLERQLDLGDHGAAPGGEQAGCAGRCPAGLHDGLRDVLGPAEGAADKDAVAGGHDRVLDGGPAEAVLLELDAQGLGQRLSFLGRREANREDDHVVLFLDELAVFLHVGDEQVLGLLELLHGGRHGADVPDAVLVLGAVHEPVEILAVGADVHEEDGRLEALGVLLADDGLLGGVHAAHAGAPGIAAVGVAGAHALDEGDLLGLLVVGQPLDVAEVGAGRGEDALELDGGDHVGVGAEAVLAAQPRLEGFEPGGGDDRAHLHRFHLVGVVVVDGLGDAGVHALVALGADAAAQAAVGFLLGVLLAHAGNDLVVIGPADSWIDVLHVNARGLLDVFQVGLALLGEPDVQLRGGDAQLVAHLGDVLVFQTLCPVLDPAFLHVDAVEEAVDGDGCLLARVDRLDDGGSAGLGVAAGEHAGHARGEGEGVDVYRVPFADGDARILGHEAQVGGLTDGGHDGVALHDEL